MKLLVFRDAGGNAADYTLTVPDGMERWRMAGFRDFVRLAPARARGDGYLPQPVDPLHYQSLRQLLACPALTLNQPVTLEQAGRRLRPDDDIDLSAEINLVVLGREPGAPESAALSVAARNRMAFDACRAEAIAAVDGLVGFAAHPVTTRDGRRVASLADVADGCRDTLDAANQLRLLYRIAEVVHAAPFENTSKLIDGIRFRSGCAMWGNMARGLGGVCAEKTAAVKFICDVLGIESSPVLGAEGAIPDDFEARLRAYVDSRGEAEQPAWIQHHLLEIEIGARRYLVDATNGNIPLTFLDDGDSQPLLAHGMRARMVYTVERLHLRRASNWVGDALLTLSEFHAPDLLSQYIFGHGLGLHITGDSFVGVYLDWGGERSAAMQAYYAARARGAGMVYPRFIHADNLHSVPDEGLRHLLASALDALRARLREPGYTGDFTFVVQPLPPHFWRRPRVSASVREVAPSTDGPSAATLTVSR